MPAAALSVPLRALLLVALECPIPQMCVLRPLNVNIISQPSSDLDL
jgi:hypothetical protein